MINSEPGGGGEVKAEADGGEAEAARQRSSVRAARQRSSVRVARQRSAVRVARQQQQDPPQQHPVRRIGERSEAPPQRSSSFVVLQCC